MKRNLLIALAFVLGSAMMFADTALVLQKTNGEEVAFFIGQKPTATPKANTIVVKSDATEVEVSYDDIRQFYFRDVASGIAELIGGSQVAFSISGSEVTATGMTAGEVMTIVGTNGAVIAKGQADSKGSCTLVIGDGIKGSYIVKTKCNTFKFMKR